MKYLAFFLLLLIIIGGTFLFFKGEKIIKLNGSSDVLSAEKDDLNKPLKNPPAIIKAVYFTSWSAGINSRVDYLIKLIKETELNAAVIDVKDYSGFITYNIKLAETNKYKTREVRIPDIDALIGKLHREDIYVIARISVFQDPALARARPDLAIKKSDGKLWLDKKGLAWIDPASKEAWDYNIAVARDAASRGFDELNFDYIRFPSDGNLDVMKFPFWKEEIPKRDVLKSFFSHLRRELKGVKISVDLFGIAATKNDDSGIGQIIEDAYPYFNYVSPMVYPSHYDKGFFGYKNPAEHPYEMVKRSMESALSRLIIYNQQRATSTSDSPPSAKLRPWLQDFDLGADYDATAVRKEIKAVYDAASSTPELINGWMLWNPSNVYTKGALELQ
jgi:hypothetical protein